MEKVHLDGYRRFKTKFFLEHRELFKTLEQGQHPHTMVITCSDSRVKPMIILNAKPGDLFIAENIGNMVPPFNAVVGDSTQAALEYAVCALKVENIVILAHSSCGACAHLYHEHKEGEQELIHVDKWLEYLQPAKEASLLEIYAGSTRDRAEITEKNNLKLALERLMTYPYIIKALEKGSVKLHGWWYHVSTGEIEVYNQATQIFSKIS